MSGAKNSTTKRIAGLLVGLLFAGVALVLMLNRQLVIDEISVWQYHPTQAVAQLAQRATLTDKGLFYFYASQPSIEATQKFNSECNRKEANGAILGCYTAQRIYVYDVTDPRLDGIREVTASHEMLHAVFERLSDDEKKQLSVLLEAEYAKLHSPELQTRMEYYAREQPGDRINELHSIIGTEVASISPELEAHYKKYFGDRQKVVKLHATYQKVFDDLTARSTALATEIAQLKDQVSAEIDSYNSAAAALEADITALKQREQTIDRTNRSEVDAYNSDRQALLGRINTLSQQKADIDQKTNTFNAEVKEYNDLVVSSNELEQKIDSTLAPSPSI